MERSEFLHYIITLTRRTVYPWFCFIFFNSKKNDKFLLAIVTGIFVCWHDSPPLWLIFNDIFLLTNDLKYDIDSKNWKIKLFNWTIWLYYINNQKLLSTIFFYFFWQNFHIFGNLNVTYWIFIKYEWKCFWENGCMTAPYFSISILQVAVWVVSAMDNNILLYVIKRVLASLF